MPGVNDLPLSLRSLLAFAALPALAVAAALLGGLAGPWALWLLAAALIAGGALAFLTGRSAERALAGALVAAQALAAGELDEMICAPAATGRLGALGAALEAVRVKLRADLDRPARASARAQADRAAPTAAERHLAQQIQRAMDATRMVIAAATDGEFGHRLDTRIDNPGLRTMSEGINGLLGSMTRMVQGIQSTAAQMQRAADEIAANNDTLARRTEEQSASLEETAASMQQMTTTVKQNAANAARASQLAVTARAQAERGGVIVNEAITAMFEINQASQKIADIIGVIDEIAFQTNLLALNAAVEAARAGEQGRGFAVVATEVRSLAGRSAAAAKQIKGLIHDSARKVEGGSARVTQSGQTLGEIVASVTTVADIVAEIAAASREQSTGIEQVNHAVLQMDELTQHNATLVQQATADARNLAALARDLDRRMARYRLDRPARSTAGAHAPPPALSAAVGA
jgi:methyl-accepting chemotaxis protein